MNNKQSLSHTVWECKYHLVWIPKYRRKKLYGQIREYLCEGRSKSAARGGRPEGPWGGPMTLYRCPEVTWSDEYFCYAGKAHPEFARGENEVVLTYAVNSWNLEDHERDLRIYWPRFVRVVEW